MNLGIGLSICRPNIITGGGYSPLDEATLDEWWRLSNKATITHASGTASVVPGVKNGYDLVQTVFPADQPAVDGVIGSNSIHGLTFGGQDFMSVARTLAQPFTFATIAQSTVMGVIQALFSFGAGAGDETGVWNSDEYRIDAGTSHLVGSTDTNAHVWLVEFNGASTRLYIDGTLIATVNAGTDGATIYRLGVRFNGFNGWQGVASDSLVFASILSSGSRGSITSFLGDLAGISVS